MCVSPKLWGSGGALLRAPVCKPPRKSRHWPTDWRASGRCWHHRPGGALDASRRPVKPSHTASNITYMTKLALKKNQKTRSCDSPTESAENHEEENAITMVVEICRTTVAFANDRDRRHRSACSSSPNARCASEWGMIGFGANDLRLNQPRGRNNSRIA